MNGTVNDIIAEYNDVIEKTISLYKVRARQYGLDLDDFRQICRITIWKCLKLKRETDPEFIHYIKVSMRKAIRSYIIRNTTGRSQQAYDKYSTGEYQKTSELLFKPCDDEELIWKSVVDDLSNVNTSIDSFISLCDNNNPVLGEILKLRMDGYTRARITHKMHIPGRTYDRRIAEIKKMYHSYFGEDNNDIQTSCSRNSHSVTIN